MNCNDSAKQEDGSSPPTARQRQNAHLSAQKEGNCKNGWTLVPHPPVSPNLLPSNFHLFARVKDAPQGRRFADDEERKHRVREELGRFNTHF
jgi:hypothetical protein